MNEKRVRKLTVFSFLAILLMCIFFLPLIEVFDYNWDGDGANNFGTTFLNAIFSIILIFNYGMIISNIVLLFTKLARGNVRMSDVVFSLYPAIVFLIVARSNVLNLLKLPFDMLLHL